ncbi:carbohydrate ABC transporter membrane protein 1, CUT1 family [Thermanaeromonas toyohensis ToBE]|uniref:Carbohydrate ABC transporter membrane protein 1, CUT1 family n=1 Tax=Thermanaeromonas toyohensis ToBE TaxID=698762 RepID=A0A1W1VVU7_9FIRM|nr:sugar ABC transporter permease [Thermanaeromonas toyohensis]SMB97370.1 carbohydrate ABC transporter membrane protein 1, CUT1 family [Thermanaeromonas toyohensis ToBE]
MGASRRQIIWAIFFVFPALFLFIFTVLYPLLEVVRLSLYEWRMVGKGPTFVGLQNYITTFHDPLFWQAVKVTVIWTLGVVPAIIVLGLGTAFLLNMKALKLKGVFRTIYFIPVVTNMVASAFVWRWLFEPTNGVVNYFLGVLGLPQPGWLASTRYALPAMMVVGVWKQIGFSMVVFLAGLQTIPQTMYEAAAIDGATRWKTFWSITLPLLNPAIVFNAIILVINAFRVFTIPYVMACGGFTYGQPGGPLDSTRVFVIHIYDLAFRRGEFGYASASAVILLVVIMCLTLLQFKVLERRIEY